MSTALLTALVAVPAYLVALAILHIISLWQLFAGSWRSDAVPRWVRWGPLLWSSSRAPSASRTPEASCKLGIVRTWRRKRPEHRYAGPITGSL